MPVTNEKRLSVTKEKIWIAKMQILKEFPFALQPTPGLFTRRGQPTPPLH